MNVKCKLGFHNWVGCKCTQCDKVQDGQHDWIEDCEKCSICGKTRYIQHEWDGCKCNQCRKTRDEQHDWTKDCEKCVNCGKTRESFHDLTNNCEKCSKCGKTRKNQHNWSVDCEKCLKCAHTRENQHNWSKDCEKCSNCSKTRENKHDWIIDCEKCSKCGKTFVKLHDWDGCLCKKCHKRKSITESGHDWEFCKCKKCNIIGELGHKWVDNKCEICGKIDFGTYTDSRDGEKYKTIKIGSQIWMAENLRYDTNLPGCQKTNYNSWYYNNDFKNSKYGRLYNYNAAKEACPPGWHIPSIEEWKILFDSLGGINIAGGKLKEIGTEHWSAPNIGATNESGFTALPSGNRGDSGSFDFLGKNAYFWAVEVNESHYGSDFALRYNNCEVDFGGYSNKPGHSVRCIKN